MINHVKKIIPSFFKKPIKKIYLYINFIFSYISYKKLSKNKKYPILKWKNRFPQLFDNSKETGFDPHYIYHPAWAARIIKKINPKKHVDISSTLNFSTMLSAFINVEFYDYRPADLKLNNLTSGKADLTSLPFADNSIESLSCMHTVEHIGLGRYGDPLDPDGDLKAIKELTRVLAPNGNLLFVVPVGKPRIQFNAHRIYSYSQIIEYFKDLKLVEFSLIPDDAINSGMVYNATENEANKQKYGCGCFWFIKI